MARSFICLRYSLLCCVVLLGIIGIAVSVGSGYFIYRLYEYPPLTPNKVCGPAALLLAMGIVTCLIGWFGYYFLDYNNVMQTLLFTVFLALITFAEMSTGIWAFIKHEEIVQVPTLEAKKAFALATTGHKQIWDRMQSRLRCCGLHGPADYADLQGVPWSCHKVTLTEDLESSESFYKIGCIYSALNHTRSVLLSVFLTSLGTVLLQICFLVVATCYVKAVKKKKEKRRQQILEATRNRSDKDTDNHVLKSKTLRSP